MNLRPYPGLTVALATALASTAPMPAAADDTDEPMVEHCYTVALTDEEVEAGMVSELDCYEVPAGTPMELPQARLTTITFAIVYDGVNGTGSAVGISSPTGVTTCTSGGSVVFGTGHAWDNRVTSTELLACGSGKHYMSDNFTGTSTTYQTITGCCVQNLNATLNNQTSSIQYAP